MSNPPPSYQPAPQAYQIGRTRQEYQSPNPGMNNPFADPPKAHNANDYEMYGSSGGQQMGTSDSMLRSDRFHANLESGNSYRFRESPAPKETRTMRYCCCELPMWLVAVLVLIKLTAVVVIAVLLVRRRENNDIDD